MASPGAGVEGDKQDGPPKKLPRDRADTNMKGTVPNSRAYGAQGECRGSRVVSKGPGYLAGYWQGPGLLNVAGRSKAAGGFGGARVSHLSCPTRGGVG